MADPFAGAAATLAQIVDLTLNDRGTITRTSAIVPVRVEAYREGGARLPLYLPAYASTARWHLIFELGTDVQDGDTVTVPGKGAYFLIEDPMPSTYASQIPIAAVKVRRANGALNLILNQAVTFIATDERYQLNETVYLYPAAMDVAVTPTAIQFDYGIVWDAAWTYVDVTNGNAPTTRKPRRDDRVVWTDDVGISHQGMLHEPNAPSSLVPFRATYFNDLVG